MKLSYGFPILFVLVEAIFAVEQQPLHKTAQLSKSPDKCCSQLSIAYTASGAEGMVASFLTAGYNETLGNYFCAQQSSLNPRCVVKPKCARDVSMALKVLRNSECMFALKGGGHTLALGGSNIEDGVVIDLELWNDIDIDVETYSVSIRPGARWQDVYKKLDALDLTIPGGRIADVGVAGLSLGGGISYFGPRTGWVCDNILEYEIIISSGEILKVTKKEHSDLFWALKGGSNNFGVVTKFVFHAFPQKMFWGGITMVSLETVDREYECQIFADFANATVYDPYAAIIQSYHWDQRQQAFSFVNIMQYTREEEYPKAFSAFTDVQLSYSSLRMAKLSEFAGEMSVNTARGHQGGFATLTIKPSVQLLREIITINEEIVRPVKDVDGLIWDLTYQPIPTVLTSESLKVNPGGNVFGILPSDGNLVVLLISISWKDSSDNQLIDDAMRKFIDYASEAAKRADAFHPFVYLNYAAGWQDPIASYGQENVARMIDISEKYDPGGTFQSLCVGGWKLGRESKDYLKGSPTHPEL